MSDRPPEADFASKVPADATPAQCIAAWLDLLDATEALLLAGLRRQIGANGNLEAAYRQWQRQRNEEHYQMLLKMQQRIAERGGGL